MININWYPGIALLEDYLATIMYFCPYERKKHYLPRLLGVFLIDLLIVINLSSIVSDGSIVTAVTYIFYFFLVLFGMKFCYKVNFTQAMFGTVAGRATQHFVSSFVYLLSAWEADFSPIFDFFYHNIGEVLIYIPWYILAYFIFAKKIEVSTYESKYNKQMKRLAAFILIIIIGISRIAKDHDRSFYELIAESLYAMTCSVLALIVQFKLCHEHELIREVEEVRRIWQEDKRRLTESKATIELINIKCHDMRNKLDTFKKSFTESEEKELEQIINIYDTTLNTGNETLDVIIAERGLVCDKYKIRFTYLGDAGCLDFMLESEIYSLFFNAISNAINAVSCLNEDKRLISVIIKDCGDLISVNISNYFEGELVFKDGLPVTTNKTEEGYHGYGIKSMRMVARKYFGDLDIVCKEGIFEVNIWMLNKKVNKIVK